MKDGVHQASQIRKCEQYCTAGGKQAGQAFVVDPNQHASACRLVGLSARRLVGSGREAADRMRVVGALVSVNPR